MKKQSLIYLLFLFIGISCTPDWDNYPEPEETLQGSIINKISKVPIQTEMGGNGIRMRLLEYSWSENPTPYDFYVKQDGTFRNTRIFKGEYNIEPQGAFVPLLQRDENGNIIKDERVTTKISGTTELTFEVEPFLNVQWVGQPVVNQDSTVTVKVKISRGTADPGFQQDVTQIYLFVNGSNLYVGNNSFDRAVSTRIRGSKANSAVGGLVTLTTGKLKGNRTYYLRVGARIDYIVEGALRYNYNAPIAVTVGM